MTAPIWRCVACGRPERAWTDDEDGPGPCSCGGSVYSLVVHPPSTDEADPADAPPVPAGLTRAPGVEVGCGSAVCRDCDRPAEVRS